MMDEEEFLLPMMYGRGEALENSRMALTRASEPPAFVLAVGSQNEKEFENVEGNGNPGHGTQHTKPAHQPPGIGG